jgi:hypothetical protein
LIEGKIATARIPAASAYSHSRRSESIECR